MEARGQARLAEFVEGTLHYGAAWPNNVFRGSGRRRFTGVDFSAGMHDFAVEWTADPALMRWLVDGVPYYERALNASFRTSGASPYTQDGQPWDQRFHLILNRGWLLVGVPGVAGQGLGPGGGWAVGRRSLRGVELAATRPAPCEPAAQRQPEPASPRHPACGQSGRALLPPALTPPRPRPQPPTTPAVAVGGGFFPPAEFGGFSTRAQWDAGAATWSRPRLEIDHVKVWAWPPSPGARNG